jgi:uncharacterized protein
MLAEHHDILHELPEFSEVLAALRTTDAAFDALVKNHDELDDEIRVLEERQSPISDEEIEKMKFRRAAMKDEIFQKLRVAAEAAKQA